jgi:hypothetical protein
VRIEKIIIGKELRTITMEITGIVEVIPNAAVG